ncbi:MAG TPA: arylesterase [Azospirillaceae bacterium]|nr:arylesterase [Azospirillaceae bacterium]HRQ82109.1 arylesterase [Azospirillaceae bacterium]
MTPVAALAQAERNGMGKRRLKLLALGDSLTAGWGLGAGEGLVPQLQAALVAQGYNVEVVNAGVSGDTTAGGLARLDWALADKPDAALVALGANDMLRGLPPETAKTNLDAVLTKLAAAGVPALLAGMKASPSLGSDYVRRFDALYPELAERHNIPLYPFFLDGVAADPTLNQGDGIHPNAAGVRRIVAGLAPMAARLLDAVAAKGT